MFTKGLLIDAVVKSVYITPVTRTEHLSREKQVRHVSMAANCPPVIPRTPTHEEMLDLAIEHEQGRLPEKALKSPTGPYAWAKTTVRTLKRWAKKLRNMVDVKREETRKALREKNTPRSLRAAESILTTEDEYPTTEELNEVR